MRKAEIIKDVSKQTGIEPSIVQVIVDNFMISIKEHLSHKEYVALAGFGRFGLKKRAAKIGRNISENKPVKIPAQFIPAFKPSRKFKEKVSKALH